MALMKPNLVVVLFFSLAIFSASNAASIIPSQFKAGCSFNLDSSSPNYPPHLIDSNKQIILPILQSSARTINLDLDQEVSVACVGTSNTLTATGASVNPAVCTSNNKLLIKSNGVEYSYSQLGCKSRNKDVIIEDGTCANGPGTLLRIGWQAGPDFIPLYESCHDKVKELNYYAVNNIVGRSANADDKDHTRPTFSQGDYYSGLAVNTLYSTATQTQTIAGILGSSALANEYIDSNTQYFFSRGHMAPDADFLDWSSQDATYYFMNAAPQWQTFNGANWNSLEQAVRNIAISRVIDLTIYTGTFGITTLDDINGVQQPIYLAFDENGNGLIPAPKYYWKLVHHPDSNTATAVIGINDPYSNVKPQDILCPDVCSQIPWVNWKVTDIAKGYTFCCTAAELRKAIDFAPDIDVPLFV